MLSAKNEAQTEIRGCSAMGCYTQFLTREIRRGLREDWTFKLGLKIFKCSLLSFSMATALDNIFVISFIHSLNFFFLILQRVKVKVRCGYNSEQHRIGCCLHGAYTLVEEISKQTNRVMI